MMEPDLRGNSSRNKIVFERKRQEFFTEEILSELAPELREKALLGGIKKSDKVAWVCPEHGRYEQYVYNHERSGCPKCSLRRAAEKRHETSRKKNPIPLKILEEMSLGDRERAIAGEINVTDLVEFVCKEHGMYSQTLTNHWHNGSGCPTCAKEANIRGSKGEQEIRDMFKDLSPVKTTIPGTRYELDVFIPSKSIAIEYNGGFFHKTVSYDTLYNKTKRYHLDKTEACMRAGIVLIHIYDHEWEPQFTTSRRYQIEQLLRKMINPTKAIGARNCRVSRIEKKEADLFCERNHVQGSSRHGVINYGLWYDNTLIATVSLGKPRFGNTEYQYEIHRLCMSEVPIIGGTEKLIGAFRKDYNPESILSYVDRAKFTGYSLERMNFDCVGETAPSYKWRYGNIVLPREKCQKSKLYLLEKDGFISKFDESKTEVENMESNGYYRVYDCGNYKYVWRRGQSEPGRKIP